MSTYHEFYFLCFGEARPRGHQPSGGGGQEEQEGGVQQILQGFRGRVDLEKEDRGWGRGQAEARGHLSKLKSALKENADFVSY